MSGYVGLARLEERVETINKTIEHNEAEAQKQWDKINEKLDKIDRIIPDDLTKRLTELETAYQRVKGAVGVLSLLVASFVTLYEFARDWITAHLAHK